MVLFPSSREQADVHRTSAFNGSNPSILNKKTIPIQMDGDCFFWRSRRDLNPRYPFGVHTISSRARYDHFDTAPCGRLSCRLRYNTPWAPKCQALFFLFSKKFLEAGAGRTSSIWPVLKWVGIWYNHRAYMQAIL